LSEEQKAKPRYSLGGFDSETRIIYEQISYRGNSVYARSDDPMANNGPYKETYTDSMDNTVTVMPEPIPWKLSEQPAEYHDEAYLFAAVETFLRVHLVFSKPEYYTVVAAWILASWRIEEWRASGPLYILGPINSGKTTVIEVLEELAYRGIRGGSMSTATMFRLSDSYAPSLLIDESQIYNREEWAEAQALINERYRPGGKVWRVVGEGNSLRPTAFKCWGPTALASSHSPWEALGSRALIVKMEKGKPERHTGTPDFAINASKLRSMLLHYRLVKLNLQPEPREGFPEAPEDPVEKRLEHIEDERTKEVGYPLLAVADPDSQDPILKYLVELEGEHQAIEEGSDFAVYVIALDKCIAEHGKVSVEDVRQQIRILWNVEDMKKLPSAKYASKVLQTLGFKPTRLPTGKAGIVWDPERMARLKQRYRVGGIASVPSDSSLTNLNEANEATEAVLPLGGPKREQA